MGGASVTALPLALAARRTSVGGVRALALPLATSRASMGGAPANPPPSPAFFACAWQGHVANPTNMLALGRTPPLPARRQLFNAPTPTKIGRGHPGAHPARGGHKGGAVAPPETTQGGIGWVGKPLLGWARTPNPSKRFGEMHWIQARPINYPTGPQPPTAS